MKDLLELHLNAIGWKLVHIGCDHHHIHNQNNEPTGYIIWQNEISHDFAGASTVFQITKDTIKEQSNNCVCIGAGDGSGDDGFVLFINPDMKE